MATAGTLKVPEKSPALVQQEQVLAQAAKATRDKLRFEIAKQAISGIALHRPDKPALIAASAVAIADAVLEALDEPRV